MSVLGGLLGVIYGLIALKAVTIGSDFNFRQFLRYGDTYMRWYRERQTWEQYVAVHKRLVRIEHPEPPLNVRHVVMSLSLGAIIGILAAATVLSWTR